MTLTKSILVGAVCLVGTTLIPNAQAQYQPYPYNQVAQQPQYRPSYIPVPVTPPQMPPTYGQHAWPGQMSYSPYSDDNSLRVRGSEGGGGSGGGGSGGM